MGRQRAEATTWRRRRLMTTHDETVPRRPQDKGKGEEETTAAAAKEEPSMSALPLFHLLHGHGLHPTRRPPLIRPFLADADSPADRCAAPGSLFFSLPGTRSVLAAF